MRKARWLIAAAACGVALWSWMETGSTQARVGAAAIDKVEPQPVEDSMHEFMEYVFQPTYRRLKPQMADEPADNAAWKAVKSDALILAEGGNLLLIRAPDEQAEVWSGHSAAVRSEGAHLYQAAKKKDYAAARRHYEAMLTNCNRCHDAFADGEHQLEP